MPVRLSSEDMAFLRRAQALADQGLTQEEIASQLDLTPSTFRYRVNNLGFEFTRPLQIATKPQFGGRTLRDLLASGDLVSDESEAAFL